MVLVHSAVGEDYYVCAVAVCSVAGDKKMVKRALKRRVFVVEKRNRLAPEAGAVYRLYLH